MSDDLGWRTWVGSLWNCRGDYLVNVYVALELGDTKNRHIGQRLDVACSTCNSEVRYYLVLEELHRISRRGYQGTEFLLSPYWLVPAKDL